MTRKKLDRTNSGAVMNSLMDGNGYSPAKFDRELKLFATAGKRWQATAHALAGVAISLSLPHVEGGHNCAQRAAQLANAFPKGTRVKAYVAWLTHFSNVRLTYDKQTQLYRGIVLKPTAKDYKDVCLASALDKPFWTTEEKDTSPTSFDDNAFASAVSKLIARAKAKTAVLSPNAAKSLADLEALGKALTPAA